MLVEVDPDKHTENTEQVDLEAEPDREFKEHQINGEGRADSWSKMRGEDALDVTLRCHHVQNLSKNSAEQSADEHKDEKNPG